MTIKIKLLILFILISIFSSYSQQNEYQELSKSIISMNIKDYRIYLKTHPPMDRLYCTGDICYFLINSKDIKKIRRSGIKILNQRNLQTSNTKLSQLQGDINGLYHNYKETETLLFDLSNRFPERAEVFSIGQSVEGRELYVIKISDNVHIDEEEPNLFIVGCHHAREWISVEIPLLFVSYLLEHYMDNPEIQRIVNGSQIYILPLLNPDGLEFSIRRYRMWRKNRRYTGDYIWGVDLNRNYGYQWGYDNRGSSPNPKGETYRGSYAFSEPESNAVRLFLLANPPAGSLSFHNYSQMILYPWGYTEESTPDEDKMNKIAEEMSKLIFGVNGRTYEYGPSSTTIYVTNGDTDDWIYATFGAPAFTIELPPTESFYGGFFTSEEEINLTFNENLPAMLYFVNYFIKNNNVNQRRKNDPIKPIPDKKIIKK